MYDETTNEWQFIASIKNPKAFDALSISDDGKLYAVSCDVQRLAGCTKRCDLKQSRHISVECYDPGENEWKVQSEITFSVRGELDEEIPCYPC